jgi:hypothetical protein
VDTIDHAQVASEAALDGVSVLVAGGPAAPWDDARVCQAWKGQEKGEHGVRLTNPRCLGGPVFLKHAQRLVRLSLLIMSGGLVAGWIERQMRRALAARHEPIHGCMPAGRDTLPPTVARILRAFADDSFVLRKRRMGVSCGGSWRSATRLHHSLDVLEIPCRRPCVGA